MTTTLIKLLVGSLGSFLAISIIFIGGLKFVTRKCTPVDYEFKNHK